MKQYFTFLEEINKEYKYIRLEDLVEFVAWLRSPYDSTKVTSLQPVKAKKTEKTINLTVTVITNFYDYLYRIENGAKLKTGEREIFVSKALMDLYDDYLYDVVDELDLDTNFVFVKLRGKNVGKPMCYGDIPSLFKRLRKKTGIDVHPHLFRHTHATIYYQKTKDIKQVQERL